jgi:hypothetical protein
MRRTKKPRVGPAWPRTASTWIPIRISQGSSPNPRTSAPSTLGDWPGTNPNVETTNTVSKRTIASPARQSGTFQDPFQIDGEGHEQQSGERGRGTGLRDKQAFPFGGKVGGHQLRPLDSVKPLAGAGMRRTLPEGGRASEEPNRIDDVGQDQHHAGDQDHATYDVGDRQ